MLQFAKRLASEGPRVTLLTTSCFSNSMHALQESSVNIEIISDGSGEDKSLESLVASIDRFRMVVSQSLSEFTERQNCSKYLPNFLVYDCTMPWALYVARERGLDGAPFFTQSCSVNAIFYHLYRGTIGLPLEGPTVSLPSMPPLGISDLPSIVYHTGSYPALLNLAFAQFSNFQEANWLFFSTFKELEVERERAIAEMERQIHILVIPYPLQGHINPILQFSKSLASRGPKVTVVTTSSIKKHMEAVQASSVNFETISNGIEEGEALSMDVYLERFKLGVSKSLTELIERQNSSEHPPNFLIYDSVMSWALDIARQLGLDGAPFFTQSCAVNALYYHARQGALIATEGPSISLPSLPSLGLKDLPSLLHDTGSYTALLNVFLNQFSNFRKANWLFVNTFNALEDKVVSWMASQWPIKTIGPSIPSMYLDKRLKDDKEYGLNLFQPEVDACMKWLDMKDVGSVVYVSFGSLAALGEEQMEEVAWGLKNSNCYFLWIVRESEQKKLPTNFLEETVEKGLVVSWCPQLDVLAHKVVGCFMTHCGWNSTLEALSLGVPMVAMPQWTDQTTNAKFIVDVWKVGVRIKVDEKGIATKEEIELRISEVMEGERGKEMKKNSMRWRELAIEAVDKGGSSDKDIQEFVATIVSSKVHASSSCTFK